MKVATLTQSELALSLSGITEAFAPMVCEYIIKKYPSPVSIIFVKHEKIAEQWIEDIEFINHLQNHRLQLRIKLLPTLPENDENEFKLIDLEFDRLATLSKLNNFRDLPPHDEHLIIITTPKGFYQASPTRKHLMANEIRLAVGDICSFRALAKKLGGELNYNCEVLCESPGQYAVRGGILDVYPINTPVPYRIDFFGDEIDDIRVFDPTTQRSIRKANTIAIVALSLNRSQLREDYIFDYLGDKVNWIFWEPTILKDQFFSLFNFPERTQSSLPTFQDLFNRRNAFPDRWFSLTELDIENPIFGPGCEKKVTSSEPLSNYRNLTVVGEFGLDRVQSEQKARWLFLIQILQWQKKGYALYFIVKNQGEEKRLQEILSADTKLSVLKPQYLKGNLHQGFIYTYEPDCLDFDWDKSLGSNGLVVVTDSEIFGRYRMRVVRSNKRLLPMRAQVDQLLDFSELSEGDFLVHLQNGVCIYRGVMRMDLAKKKEEVISLEFDNGIILHLPLHESHLLSRYVGLSKTQPKLGRIGTSGWERTRRAAERATLDFAAELLSLQAKRSHEKGHAFGVDVEWQKEFENSFIYQETKDQLITIKTVKDDMEKKHPTDRLICGDVGYGKTEVALRAAFKSVMDNKQVAILVPTTVLAQQHFNTFRERMADYPVVVEMLSRFRTQQQQKTILRQVSEGKVDILIGTHRLLSGDVDFRDLGLLVIDEEHRFGVKHKEKLKLLRKCVDVIAMSATPIPRTLYLALMGARDLSVIETPPTDRIPIHTLVKNYSVDLVKDAIEFEVARGGQVFYLHNRVDTIFAVAERLQKMLNNVRIAIGHGQMPEHHLEDIMTKFVAGEFDVLVCTTIIESGLDIPNCNTIIIESADRFGLSQLYQLRGRVGRFKEQAYAYLLINRKTYLEDQARKRLSAIRQYKQLGSGFKIAMRDLELRGAGNLLGPQQSGHIAGVGFDLYCQLLRQSISRLKGEDSAQHIRAGLRLDFVIIGDSDGMENSYDTTKNGFEVIKNELLKHTRIPSITAFVPIEYISETRLRIDIYRRLALADSQKSVVEIVDSLNDRFGPIPQAMEALLLVTEIRILAESQGILTVETEGDRLKCLLASGKSNNFIKIGNHFPRLNTKHPLPRLKEIISFLVKRLP